jgi:hypothetical protein
MCPDPLVTQRINIQMFDCKLDPRFIWVPADPLSPVTEELTELNRIHIPCPIANCKSFTLTIIGEHCEMVGDTRATTIIICKQCADNLILSEDGYNCECRRDDDTGDCLAIDPSCSSLDSTHSYCENCANPAHVVDYFNRYRCVASCSFPSFVTKTRLSTAKLCSEPNPLDGNSEWLWGCKDLIF